MRAQTATVSIASLRTARLRLAHFKEMHFYNFSSLMKKQLAITIFLLAIFSMRVWAQSEFGFAFYNVDRLYDTLPSPFYNDSDYTPEGRLHWTSERYNRKVARIAAVLDSLAVPVTALYGVENEGVVRDIVAACGCDYSYIHRTLDSFDGLDFALLYFGDLVTPEQIVCDRRSMTVTAKVGERNFGFILCNRAQNCEELVENVYEYASDALIIAAGDLRDTELEGLGFRDITSETERRGKGNALTRSGWRMYDRVAVRGEMRAVADVYAHRGLLDKKGAPQATFEGRIYRGGAGRRLPVFVRISVDGRR